MNLRKEIQHIYLVGAKSLGAYGGYETFVYKLTEYHQNNRKMKQIAVQSLQKYSSKIRDNPSSKPVRQYTNQTIIYPSSHPP